MRLRIVLPTLLAGLALTGTTVAGAAPALHGQDRLLGPLQVPGYSLLTKPAAVHLGNGTAPCQQPLLPGGSLAVAEEFARHAKGEADGDYLGEVLVTTPSPAAAQAFLVADLAVVRRCGRSPQSITGYALGAVRVRRAPSVAGSPAGFQEDAVVPRQRGIAGGTLTIRLYEAGRRVVVLISSHATAVHVGGVALDSYGSSGAGEAAARSAAIAAVAAAAVG